MDVALVAHESCGRVESPERYPVYESVGKE
jgi:hypothetical protein